MKSLLTRNRLSLFIGMALAVSAGAAYAQNTTSNADNNAQASKKVERLKTIMVTGSLIPQIDMETPAPVQVISAEQIKRSGFTSVSQVIRAISANNSGTIPNAFALGFAAGASGVALRGLNVGSTLVLIDGQRSAPYALDDDGQRSFTDLNTIPLNAVARIEVLKASASSIYGSAAIGGVVNVIMRRTFHGVEASGEMGTSQHGGGTMTTANFMAGTGSLERDGHNEYIDVEYSKSDPIYNSQRGFPFNTANLSSIGGNNLIGGQPFLNNGSIYGSVAPATLGTAGNLLSGQQVPGSLVQPLQPCGPGSTSTTTAGVGTYCTQNFQGQYGEIAPQQQRYAIDGRVTFKLNSDTTGYINASYVQVQTIAAGATGPAQIQNTVPVNTNAIALPPKLLNGQPNPNDPFAAQNQYALINYAFGGLPNFGSFNYTNHNMRLVADLHGYFDSWRYNAAAVINHTYLTENQYGYLNIPTLLNDVQTGADSFTNPASNSPAVLAALAPPISNTATTDLQEASLTVSHHLWRLPGGRSALALGGSVRHESQYEPELNPGNQALGLGNTQIIGSHKVASLYGEFQAPLLKTLEADISGRFSDYSDFGSNFSPAAGFKWQPFQMLAIRGTFSKGFRAPSFAENGSSQTTGFITEQVPASFAALHGNDAYTLPYSIAVLSTANPNIRPETSTSYTLGAVVQPLPNLSATIDYYHIKVNNIITAGNIAVPLNAYFAGQPIPPGYTMQFDNPDPNAPGAPLRPILVGAPYINANSLLTKGVDVDLRGNFHIMYGLHWISEFTATDILTWKKDFGQGYLQMAGTQGPYILSSGAGTPKWRASWSNTLTNGKWSATASIYYVSHLYMSVPDATGNYSCFSVGATGGNFPANCTVPSFTYVDLNGSYHLTHNIDIFGGIENLFDRGPGFDPIDYAGLNYNPTYQQQGIIGRYFQLGVRVRM
ncbi:TonB-dependent receptor [Metallibacterium scheffleri]|jgi:iron complex outermembrane receptor protein|uniref:TonB-dependent receptor plug domain-containing protein n=1 Tax=Metallibacterium scheffleri TaxID=993689 RepID=UPI0026F00D07|nr:TonB-dependent receptor [Metallibacterium scheffleri]MBW8073881.1 TonB-dependent receptor [Metallibacterium scheffleri]